MKTNNLSLNKWLAHKRPHDSSRFVDGYHEQQHSIRNRFGGGGCPQGAKRFNNKNRRMRVWGMMRNIGTEWYAGREREQLNRKIGYCFSGQILNPGSIKLQSSCHYQMFRQDVRTTRWPQNPLVGYSDCRSDDDDKNNCAMIPKKSMRNIVKRNK